MAPRTVDEEPGIIIDDSSNEKELSHSAAAAAASTNDDKNEVQQSLEQPKQPWPEDTSNHWYQKLTQSLTYSYMGPLLQKGRRQFLDGDHLTQEDLYQVPSSMNAKDLVTLFRQYYTEEQGQLWKVLWKLAAPTFVPAGFYQLIYVAARVSLPLAMRGLLMALEDNPNQAIVREGLPYVVVIFVAAVAAAFAQHREVHLATQAGIVMRAALISMIYEHSLRLSPGGKTGLSGGEVTNLVATDTQKIFEVTLEGHLVWSCPLFVIIVTVLLWVVMGPELIVGVVVLIGFVPIVKMIVSRMLKIRKKRAILADKRINIITAMLQGIRVTKLNDWFGLALDRIETVRRQEMKLLRSELFMWGWTMVSAVCSPLLAVAASFSFYALVNENNIITPASAFTVLLLFSILRFPINMGARLVGKIGTALEAAGRISDFLRRDTQSDAFIPLEDTSEGDNNTPLRLINATYTVEGQTLDSELSTSFSVRDVNMTVKRSDILGVVGKVGSGKSVLLQGLLGELEASPTSQVHVKGSVGYAAQVPFVLNQSLRDNILFGESFDRTKYQRVLAACSLEQDIQRFPGGDMCQIGERGITLSGGQKQRVSLARVLYAEPDIALLDDVFSALDGHTAKAVFEGLFGSDGALKSQAVVLVTHATKFLQYMDNLIVLSDGSTVFSGTYAELLDKKGHAAIDALNQDGQKPVKKTHYVVKDNFQAEIVDSAGNEQDEMIMTDEDRQFGLSKLRVWLTWFRYAGGWSFFVTQILLLTFDRTMYVASEWWISLWGEGSSDGAEAFGRIFLPQTDGRSAQLQYISVYFIILALSIFGTTLRSHFGIQGGARCAERLFTVMIRSVLGAPLSYFETTPLGRILNRFTYDVEVLDIELSVSMAGLLISCSWFTASLVVMMTILPWIICVLIPVIISYLMLQRYHRFTGPDLQRLDAMSRSPIQAQLAEGLDGSSTIRAYKKHAFFVYIFHKSVDQNSVAMLLYDGAQRWLALRIELLGSLITLSACLMVVFGNEVLTLSSGLVGFLIIWSIVFTTALGFLLQRFTETEARITAIERIQSTSKLPQEAARETDLNVVKLEGDWPSKGELRYENVSLRYRAGLPLALDSVSFCLRPGTRTGVVGRTGSGKSTLTVALFRLVEIESGRITLDGVDLSLLGLSDVRGRRHGLRIIPQDPVLFSGSLRDCLDPFHTKNDEDLLEALEAVNHTGCDRGLSVLNDRVDEGGSNYSVGERQLLCLARALVEEARLLVLDEASASLDAESDKRIQNMLRNRFQNTTMLTIAHRLDTILDYDQILVLENGSLAEFGKPQDLIADSNGIFTSLVGQSSGISST